MQQSTTSEFYNQIRDAHRLLVLDLGFLGDTIHLIPALWMIRTSLPQAQLDVMVAEHVTSILELTPWIDNVLGYPRFPVGPKWYEDFGRIARLRQRRYDAVINLNGSDRTSILTRLTGAPLRLGRVPQRGASLLWKQYFTHTVETPFRQQATYKQHCLCLEKAGFTPMPQEFHITIPERIRKKIDHELKDTADYVHISPFTTVDSRELPGEILAEAVNQCDFNFIVSCAPTDREKHKLDGFLKLLRRPSLRVFPGTLSVNELAALVARSTLHLGGDSGALHIALMTGTPSVSWFRKHPGNIEWIPDGPMHRHLIGEESPSGIKGISTEDLIASIAQLM